MAPCNLYPKSFSLTCPSSRGWLYSGHSQAATAAKSAALRGRQRHQVTGTRLGELCGRCNILTVGRVDRQGHQVMQACCITYGPCRPIACTLLLEPCALSCQHTGSVGDVRPFQLMYDSATGPCTKKSEDDTASRALMSKCLWTFWEARILYRSHGQYRIFLNALTSWCVGRRVRPPWS